MTKISTLFAVAAVTVLGLAGCEQRTDETGTTTTPPATESPTTPPATGTSPETTQETTPPAAPATGGQ
jgi:hypothetical protein